jgi:hypothetical protein
VALVATAAFAGPPQARAWIGQGVGNIAHSVRHSGDDNPPPPQGSPLTESPVAAPTEHRTTTPEPVESPESSRSPEPSESPAPHGSPEPEDSPRPSPSPGGPTPTPTPTPRPSGE